MSSFKKMDKEEDDANHKNNGEEMIEIDFGMISGAKAKRVKHLYITERFMKTGVNEVQPTVKELKNIFIQLKQHLEQNIETIHVELDSTQITGSMLGSCMSNSITELHVQSGLVLIHQDDRTALGKVIYEHEFLTTIVLHNLLVKERLINRWNSNPAPPLDILVPAFTSVTFLNTLELSCCCPPPLPTPPSLIPSSTTVEQQPSPTPTAVEAEAKQKWNLSPTTTTTTRIIKPMLSLLGVKELIHGLTLQRLELSRLGLMDDHYGVLVEQVSQGSSRSCLKTLILNENSHTDLGLDMLASLLYKSDCKLEHLECYQSESVVVGTSLLLFEQAVKENTTIRELRIHLPGDDNVNQNGSTTSSLIPFFLELNRKGRKCLVDQKATQEQWIHLIGSVKEDPALLFYCLRNSGFWWTCRDVPKSRPKDFVMPPPVTLIVDVTPPVSPLGFSPRSVSGRRKSSQRLKVLKAQHGELLNSIDLDAVDDESSLGDANHLTPSDSSIARELDAKNIPHILSLGKQMDDMDASAISIGADSYINDLLHQKEKRPREAREEVLEDALDELQYAIAHDKLPPGMSKDLYFHKVLERLKKEKKKELAKQDKKLDSLLKKALIQELEGKVAAAASKEKLVAKAAEDKIPTKSEEDAVTTGEKAEKPSDEK